MQCEAAASGQGLRGAVNPDCVGPCSRRRKLYMYRGLREGSWWERWDNQCAGLEAGSSGESRRLGKAAQKQPAVSARNVGGI